MAKAETGRLLATVNVAVKIGVVVLAAMPLVVPDWPQFLDKWLAIRSFVYPPLMLAMPPL
jgi:hypothetical protein